jgi:hypothetical protein
VSGGGACAIICAVSRGRACAAVNGASGAAAKAGVTAARAVQASKRVLVEIMREILRAIRRGR